MDKKKTLKNTLFWGFVLWLFGYILGFVFYAFVPKDSIGWYILPFGVIVTVWVLLRKVSRESFLCYLMVGVVWAVMAVVLDYIFIVMMLGSADYYKLDVYVYYLLTLAMPAAVGASKLGKGGDAGERKK